MIFLRKDDWLSSLISKQALHGSLSIPENGISKLDTAALSTPSFIDVKVPTSDLNSVRKLEALGFFIIETALTFETKDVVYSLDEDEKVIVRPTVPDDKFYIEQIAANSFTNSRFHQDRELSTSADTIKKEWASNFFYGKRGSRMLVGEVDRSIAGFLLLIDTEEETIIDLIATSGEFRGRGVASKLIRNCKNESYRPIRIRVGTQSHNIPSVRLYESLGFRLVQSHYVLHFHTNEIPAKLCYNINTL